MLNGIVIIIRSAACGKCAASPVRRGHAVPHAASRVHLHHLPSRARSLTRLLIVRVDGRVTAHMADRISGRSRDCAPLAAERLAHGSPRAVHGVMAPAALTRRKLAKRRVTIRLDAPQRAAQLGRVGRKQSLPAAGVTAVVVVFHHVVVGHLVIVVVTVVVVTVVVVTVGVAAAPLLAFAAPLLALALLALALLALALLAPPPALSAAPVRRC